MISSVLARSASISAMVLLAASHASVKAPPKDINVILIVVDALRADHLGAYGYRRDTSPHIDRLAKEGVLFREAVAPANWTLPSVASIMTSLYPPVHGARRMPSDAGWMGKLSQNGLVLGAGERLEGAFPTLAGLLAGQGYTTAGIVASPFVFSPFGIGRGFQEYQDKWDNLRSLDESKVFPWLARHRGRRFFLYIHPFDVHCPYGVIANDGSPYPEKWDRGYQGKIDGRLDTLGKIDRGEMRLSPADLAHLVSLYDDGISFLDVQIGKLLDRLRDEKLLDRTLIVFTSDHGDGFLEHGQLLHAHSPFDEVLRVPLILRIPRGPRGLVLDRQVSSVDIFPTILDFLGLPVPGRAQGQSLLPIVRGEAGSDSVALSEAQVYDGGRRDRSALAEVARTAEWKLIRFPSQRVALYHLSDDPGEAHDVAAEHPDVAARLGNQLDSRFGESQRRRALMSPGQPAAPLDTDLRSKLKAAGYLQ